GLMAVVARLCVWVDGLPLALELAARQAGVLPLPRLLERLDDRLTLLIGGARGAPERHQSLRAVIGWSYDLLDATERAVFRRLSVPPGGFDRHTAAAVCADLGLDAERTWALLRGLTDKSMLVADGTHGPDDAFRV